ncbi:MAG: hypothetical protein G01um101433_601 [Parcubacteria group bacterium Gr01-1014_33]|nr:MAG: hypothetical protein G01um101433_601 [Parcubacteria group bacterium Gr01-1014_33]
MTDKKEEKPKELEANTKAVAKKELTSEEIEDLKKWFSTPHFSEKPRLRELNELEKTKKLTKEQAKRKSELSVELAVLNGLENGTLLHTLVTDNKMGDALVKMKKDLTEEYQCKSTSERMLIDKIVAGYWKGMRYEMYLYRLTEPEPDKFLLNEFKIKALKELHKGIELSNRQFEMGLTMLKNLKQPRLNVRVTADNAYVAQNQQIINTDEVNQAPKENH